MKMLTIAVLTATMIIPTIANAEGWASLAKKILRAAEISDVILNLQSRTGMEGVGYTSIAVCIDDRQIPNTQTKDMAEACYHKYRGFFNGAFGYVPTGEKRLAEIQSRLERVVTLSAEAAPLVKKSLRGFYNSEGILFSDDPLKYKKPPPLTDSLITVVDADAWLSALPEDVEEPPEAVQDEISQKMTAIKELIDNQGKSGIGMATAAICIYQEAEKVDKGLSNRNPINRCMGAYNHVIKQGTEFNAYDQDLLDKRMTKIVTYSIESSRQLSNVPLQVLYELFDIPFAIGIDHEEYIY